MKLNYADRKTDKNILKKKVKMANIEDGEFKGKISLIEIEEIAKEFKANRPNKISETVIAKDYKIMTYFPIDDTFSMTVMYDNNWNLLQWYFDMERYKCKYDFGVPYSEDLYLDLVVLPDGTFYTLDENELKEALMQKLISKDEYAMAYKTMDKIVDLAKNDFQKLCNFTKKSLENLRGLELGG